MSSPNGLSDDDRHARGRRSVSDVPTTLERFLLITKKNQFKFVFNSKTFRNFLEFFVNVHRQRRLFSLLFLEELLQMIL